MEILVQDLPMAGTLHLGEWYQYGDADNDGDKEFVHTTAQPHVWNQSLVYLTLMAFYNNESFSPPYELTAGCLGEVGPETVAGASAQGGCACRLAGSGAGSSGSGGLGAGALGLLLAIGFWSRRRRYRIG